MTRLLAGGVQVRIVDLRCAAPEIEARAAALSPEERARADRAAHADVRRRFVRARVALREMLGEALKVHPAHVEFAYGTFGKPRLGGACSGAELHFNLSHTGDLAVIAVSDLGPVGIDIEALAAPADLDRLARRVFTDQEYAEFLQLQPSSATEAFFNGWTRKEAVLKAIGLGLTFPMEQCDVTIKPAEPARLRSLDGEPAPGWTLESFEPDTGFVGAVALAGAVLQRHVVPRRLA